MGEVGESVWVKTAGPREAFEPWLEAGEKPAARKASTYCPPLPPLACSYAPAAVSDSPDRPSASSLAAASTEPLPEGASPASFCALSCRKQHGVSRRAEGGRGTVVVSKTRRCQPRLPLYLVLSKRGR